MRSPGDSAGLADLNFQIWYTHKYRLLVSISFEIFSHNDRLVCMYLGMQKPTAVKNSGEALYCDLHYYRQLPAYGPSLQK